MKAMLVHSSIIKYENEYLKKYRNIHTQSNLN